MRRSVLAVSLAAVGLAAIWSFVTTAQEIDATSCERACEEQKDVCISVCGTHANPVDCEDRCDDQFEDCLGQCR